MLISFLFNYSMKLLLRGYYDVIEKDKLVLKSLGQFMHMTSA
jgi:hypothetical protein